MKTSPATLLCLALVAATAGCSPPAASPEPVRAVRTQVVVQEGAAQAHEFAAEARAATESRLAFRVGGKLVSRAVEVGQHVKVGQVLARLDPADLQLARQAAQAARRSAEVSYELAQAEFQRYQELRVQGFISELDLQRRETTLRAQKAQLDQAQAQLEVQGHQAAYAELRADVAGVITAVDAEVGAVLAAGTPVLRLAHDGPRDAVFSVPEDSVVAVRGLLGRPGALRVRPWASRTETPATLREVASAADPATRTFLLKADLGKAQVQLGQTLTVVIEQPRREGVIRLPLSAVTQLQGQTSVWLLDRTKMTVNLQPVVVGGADGNSVLVAAGLQAGQTVVTAGVHTLTPGQTVKLAQDPTIAPASAASPAAPAASR